MKRHQIDKRTGLDDVERIGRLDLFGALGIDHSDWRHPDRKAVRGGGLIEPSLVGESDHHRSRDRRRDRAPRKTEPSV
jgi:hypothetical protein